MVHNGDRVAVALSDVEPVRQCVPHAQRHCVGDEVQQRVAVPERLVVCDAQPVCVSELDVLFDE
jgi:hypothetical protein